MSGTATKRGSGPAVRTASRSTSRPGMGGGRGVPARPGVCSLDPIRFCIRGVVLVRVLRGGASVLLLILVVFSFDDVQCKVILNCLVNDCCFGLCDRLRWLVCDMACLVLGLGTGTYPWLGQPCVPVAIASLSDLVLGWCGAMPWPCPSALAACPCLAWCAYLMVCALRLGWVASWCWPC